MTFNNGKDLSDLNELNIILNLPEETFQNNLEKANIKKIGKYGVYDLDSINPIKTEMGDTMDVSMNKNINILKLERIIKNLDSTLIEQNKTLKTLVEQNEILKTMVKRNSTDNFRFESYRDIDDFIGDFEIKTIRVPMYLYNYFTDFVKARGLKVQESFCEALFFYMLKQNPDEFTKSTYYGFRKIAKK